MASDQHDSAPKDRGPSSEPGSVGAGATRDRKPTRLGRKVWLALFVLFFPLASLVWSYVTYPSDRTPEGAYLRVVTAINRGKPEEFFAYTEETAQHAAYTIRDYRKKAQERILASYPEPEKSQWAERYRRFAEAPDGADVFAIYARERGWMDRLRRDMSGIDRVETQGERATVLTVRATRYPFRRRPNGIWGLTLFTAALNAEAERAARDYQMVEKAAEDYERAKRR
jgi:hypothetical protein